MSKIQIKQAEPVNDVIIDEIQAAIELDTGLMAKLNQPKREPKLVIGLNPDKSLDK